MFRALTPRRAVIAQTSADRIAGNCDCRVCLVQFEHATRLASLFTRTLIYGVSHKSTSTEHTFQLFQAGTKTRGENDIVT